MSRKIIPFILILAMMFGTTFVYAKPIEEKVGFNDTVKYDNKVKTKVGKKTTVNISVNLKASEASISISKSKLQPLIKVDKNTINKSGKFKFTFTPEKAGKYKIKFSMGFSTPPIDVVSGSALSYGIIKPMAAVAGPMPDIDVYVYKKDGSAPIKAPKTSKITKIKKEKNAITVKWKKISGVEKYQIAYKQKGHNKKWKYKKVNATENSLIINKLKSKKKYEIKVRSYKKFDTVKKYSKWSKIKSFKAK